MVVSKAWKNLAALAALVLASFAAVTYVFTPNDKVATSRLLNTLGFKFQSSMFNEPEPGGADWMLDEVCTKRLNARKVSNGLKPPQLVSYHFLLANVYSKRGFLPVSECTTDPWLRLVHRDQAKPDYCLAVFRNWTVANNKSAPRPPPKSIPPEMLDDFLLENNVGYSNLYFSDHFGSSTFNWPKAGVQAYVEKAKKKVNMAYGSDTQTVIRAVQSIPMDVVGYKAAVIGSIHPWVEAILLVNGVSSILTVEYGKITTDHPQLSYAHPTTISHSYFDTFADRTASGARLTAKPKVPELFDVVVTFSSIEHAGLGRFGDVMDPWGDVREMQKIWCMLKPGGIAMIGFPEKNDQVVFNAHRVYGPIRLPLMTAGFEVVSIFLNNGSMDLSQFSRDRWPMYSQTQRMIVLKKIV